jgi:hypothetical protein
MPLVTASPRSLQNGSILTEFTNSTNVSPTTYTFPTPQTSLIIENSGENDVFVTVGGYTDQVVKADAKWKVDVSYTSFSIRSDVNSQEFIVTAIFKEAQSLSEVNAQVANAGKYFDELNVTASKYGANPSEADNAPFINEALAALKANGGGTLLIPEGYFKIKSPIVVSGVGVYLKAASLYKTRIIADSSFVGAELIRLDQDQVTFNKGVGLEGFYIDCNNVNAHGVTVVNAYDQSGLKHVEVRNTNDNFINFNFIQPDAVKLGQTLLLENLIGEKYGNTSTKPVYFFEKYQEVNLVGCKAFPNKANSTPLNGSLRVGDGFYFKDCRGFTLTGCSSAFGDNAVVIHSETRNVAGFTFVGQTNEQITGYAIKTVNPNSRSIETITCLPIRAEGPSGKFLLDKTTLCTLYTLAASVEITSGSSQNTIFTTDTSKVTNAGIGNTVLGLSNYNTVGFSVMELLRILKASSPAMYLGVDSQTVDKRARFSYNASESTDTGISIDKKIAGAYVQLMELIDGTVEFNDSTGATHTSFKPAPANGYAGMLLTYRADSVTQYRQVLVGAIDSAGTGYRTLRVPN